MRMWLISGSKVDALDEIPLSRCGFCIRFITLLESKCSQPKAGFSAFVTSNGKFSIRQFIHLNVPAGKLRIHPSSFVITMCNRIVELVVSKSSNDGKDKSNQRM